MQLFGKPAVRRGDSARVGIPNSLQPLLGYLCLERAASCHRERVVEALWPGLPAPVGRRRLNTVVWRARALFGGDRDAVLQVSRGGMMRLDRRRIEVDVFDTVAGLDDATRTAAARGVDEAVDLLARAAHVDAQDFLVGCYDDWVVHAREELASAVVSVLETLIAAAPGTAEAIGWAELLLRRDPLREDMHRRLIRLYVEAGRRADALRQYETCERHLREELGVDPLVETSLVAAAVRAGVRPMEANAPNPTVALRELRGALASCRSAVEQIERALSALP
jgi:DNA-binding SARP family transcriptional activator